MKISALYKKHTGKEIYIVGSGPSLRVFPTTLLTDKITICLNRAWESCQFDPTYFLSIHPETFEELHATHGSVVTKVKGKLTGNEDFYFFTNNSDVFDFSYLYTTDNTLYVGRGIHTAAMCLAAKMGARVAYLVGCDFADLGGDHHAKPQNVRFHGLRPKEVYREYYVNAIKVREKLKGYYAIDILSVTPFIGLGYHIEEYESMLKDFSLAKHPNAIDDSSYKRKIDFK